MSAPYRRQRPLRSRRPPQRMAEPSTSSNMAPMQLDEDANNLFVVRGRREIEQQDQDSLGEDESGSEFGVAEDEEEAESAEEEDEFEDESDSEDEFRPQQMSKKERRRAEQDAPEGFAGAEDDEEDEEFGDSSSEGEELVGDSLPSLHRTQTQKQTSGRGETQRNDGTSFMHGGFEDIALWRTEAAERRERQTQLRRDSYVEVRQDELEDLATAFSGVNGGVSTQNVGQWHSALHADRDADGEEMNDDEFEQDLRTAVGFRRKTMRDGEGRIRKAPREQALSMEVQNLLADANASYLSNDLEETIDKLTEVIRINPAVRSAWGTMAICLEELNQTERHLQCRIMEAHLTSRPMPLWLELAEKSRNLGFNEQCLYCLSKAIASSQEKDRSDVLDIMWNRAQVLLGMGDERRAVKQFLQMLRFRPNNQGIIRALIPVLYSLQMFDKAVRILQDCAEWNMQAYPNPEDPDVYTDVNTGNTYESNEIVTLADLLLELDQPTKAIDVLRRGQRWLQGRGTETFWDEVQSDDREYDSERARKERQGDYGRQVNFAQINTLDLEFRLRLGIARARLGDVFEAQMHFDLWNEEGPDIVDRIYEYGRIVDEYIRMAIDVEDDDDDEAKRLYEKALDIALRLQEIRYDHVQYMAEEDEEQLDIVDLMTEYKRVAACYMGLEEFQQSVRFLEEVVQSDTYDFDSKIKLAEAFEALNDHNRAVELIREVMRDKREVRPAEGGVHRDEEMIDASPPADEAFTQSLSLFAEISQRAKGGSGQRSSAGKGTREEALRLESVNEAEAIQLLKSAKRVEDDVFIDRWWHPDCPFTEKQIRRRYGYHESSGGQKQRIARVGGWLNHMERLVNMFTDTPQLYPRDKSKKFAGLFRKHRKRGDRIDRQARALLARIGRVMIDEDYETRAIEKSTFRGIPLTEWVDVLMQYAFVLTKVGEFSDAHNILLRALKSNVVWTDIERSQSLSLCLASCALYAGRWDIALSEMALRSLPNRSQFQSEPLRILSVAANGGGYAGHRALGSPNNLKFFLRRSRISEALAQGCQTAFNFAARRWVTRVKLFEQMGAEEQSDDEFDDTLGGDGRAEQEGNAGMEDDDDDDGVDTGAFEPLGRSSRSQDEAGDIITLSRLPRTTKDGESRFVWAEMVKLIKIGLVKGITVSQHKPPTKYNPANDVFYAGLLLTSSNGIPSMGYWLRAYARFNNDALVCLGSAVACLGRATNRQVDNRHQVVTEAFAFLHLYRQLRRREEKKRQRGGVKEADQKEVEYNFGRAAHSMGLFQLAVEHYEKVLDRHGATSATKYDQIMVSVHDDDNDDAGQEGDGHTSAFPLRPSSFDCSAEAAYALHLIYILSGNPVLANAIVERHLRV